MKQEVVEFKEAWDSARMEEQEDFSGGRCGKFQQKLWDLFDKPHTSLPARVGRAVLTGTGDVERCFIQMIALTSSLFIFLSVTILTLATLPTFTTEDGADYPPFAICEAVATLWFSLEFLLRLLASPDKKKKYFNEKNLNKK